MARADDEARTLRSRDLARRDDLDRLGAADATPSGPALLRTTSYGGTYPTAAKRVYGVQCVRLSATPTVGATPTFTAYGPVFLAVHTGTTAPPSGTVVSGVAVGGRWSFDY